MEESYTCPWCGASGGSTIKKGFRKTKTIGTRSVRLCNKCGRKFTPKNQDPQRPAQSDATEPETRFDVASEPPATTDLDERRAG